jgi:hypothetical protein
LQKQAGKEAKKPLQPMDENSMKKSDAKAGKKYQWNVDRNSTVKLAAKEGLNALNNMKVQLKQRAKQA